MKACPARKGDYLEFFAEIDLLCAMSCCPGGDLSVDLWGEDAQDPLHTCNPLGVEIYRVKPELLKDWTSPECSPYKGKHGRQAPQVDWTAIKKQSCC